MIQRTLKNVCVRWSCGHYGLSAGTVCSSHFTNALLWSSGVQGRISDDRCGSVAHDYVAEITEERSLQGLTEEISNHFLGGAIQQVCVPFCDSVFDKEKRMSM